MSGEKPTIDSFRDLAAWKKGMDLVCLTHEHTKQLPQEEQYGLKSQMRRCALSISSNTAEGWNQSTPEYLRYLRMARGSVHELSTQAELCGRLGYRGEWASLVEATEEVGRIINELIASLERYLNHGTDQRGMS